MIVSMLAVLKWQSGQGMFVAFASKINCCQEQLQEDQRTKSKAQLACDMW